MSMVDSMTVEAVVRDAMRLVVHEMTPTTFTISPQELALEPTGQGRSPLLDLVLDQAAYMGVVIRGARAPQVAIDALCPDRPVYRGIPLAGHHGDQVALELGPSRLMRDDELGADPEYWADRLERWNASFHEAAPNRVRAFVHPDVPIARVEAAEEKGFVAWILRWQQTEIVIDHAQFGRATPDDDVVLEKMGELVAWGAGGVIEGYINGYRNTFDLPVADAPQMVFGPGQPAQDFGQLNRMLPKLTPAAAQGLRR